jgi:hypothetical protein
MSSAHISHKERTKNNFLKTRTIEIVPVREPILIVCEDSKSSVFYFNEKRQSLRLEATSIKITGESGSHPSSVVEFARLEKEKNKKECKKNGKVPYKHIYCVFDVDEHQNLSDAIQRAKDLKFIPIVSNQSFEVWYLFHFIKDPIGWTHRDELNKMLSIHIKKDYSKGEQGMYALIRDKEEHAIQLSEKILASAKEESEDRNPYRNPSTEVHIIVKKLNQIAGK